VRNPGGGDNAVYKAFICCLSCEGNGGSEYEVYVSWVNCKETGGGKNDMCVRQAVRNYSNWTY